MFNRWLEAKRGLSMQLSMGTAAVKTSGTVKVGCSTKKLLLDLPAEEIIVIQHDDVDEMAAYGIVEAKVKAVINAGKTMTGKYPAKGPLLLLQAGIPVIEVAGEDFTRFADGDEVYVVDHHIYLRHEVIE